ncbi:MAG: hypothetical protein ACOYXT_12025 [Bacteroidota bacterium]
MAKIEFDIGGVMQLQLNDFKAELLGRLNQKFSRHLYFDLNNEQLSEMINQSQSFEELINLFLRGPRPDQLDAF